MGQGKQIKTAVSHTAVQQWSGPIPAPDSLAKYETIIPGSAERILVMAEKEQNHRHEIEEKTAKRQSGLAMISTVFAFISVLALISLVAYAISRGNYNTALAAVISAIAAVAGVFGLGKLFRAKENA